VNAKVKRNARVGDRDDAGAGGGAEVTPHPRALRLRPLRDEDEAAFIAAHRAMAVEGFTFGLGYEPGKP
jgi:hypothetical protein